MTKTIKRRREWKPVQLDSNLISGNIEGLVGIEELTDYKLSRSKGFCSNIMPKMKKKDRIVKKTGSNKWEVSSGKLKTEINIPSSISVISRASHLNSSKKSRSPLPWSGVSKPCSTKKLALSDRAAEHNLNIDDRDLLPWSMLGISSNVARALLENDLKNPTPIQALSIPPAIMGKRDILGAAVTGCGKTLAFGLPIIQGILQNLEKQEEEISAVNIDSEESEHDCEVERGTLGCVRVVSLDPSCGLLSSHCCKLQALVVTPTRELAIQIRDHLVAAAKYTPITVVAVVGGMCSEKQERLLRRRPEIVVGTPGRLWQMIQQGNEHFARIEDIRYLVIDETDRMVERDHFPELLALLERINRDKVKAKLRQNFAFSATLTLVHEPPSHVVTKKGRRKPTRLTSGQKLQSFINLVGITNPKVVDVTRETGIAELLKEARIMCKLEEKDLYLYYLIQRHPGRTLVFCNSIGCVRRLATLLGLLQAKPLPIHANMMQRQRLKNLDSFRDNPCGLLLATDVAARGLDIPQVQHVIHYQVPRTSELYVHRSGRTARACNEGLTVLLVEPKELQYYMRLCRTLGRDKELPEFPVEGSLLAVVRDRVNLARELDKLSLRVKKNNAHASWVERAAKEMDLYLEEDEMPEKLSGTEAADYKRMYSVKMKNLSALLAKPLLPKDFSYRYPTLNSDASSLLAPHSSLQALRNQATKEKMKKKISKRP